MGFSSWFKAYTMTFHFQNNINRDKKLWAHFDTYDSLRRWKDILERTYWKICVCIINYFLFYFFIINQYKFNTYFVQRMLQTFNLKHKKSLT